MGRLPKGTLRAITTEEYARLAKEVDAKSFAALARAVGSAHPSLTQEFRVHRSKAETDLLKKVFAYNKRGVRIPADFWGYPFDDEEKGAGFRQEKMGPNTSEKRALENGPSQRISRSGCATHDTLEAKGESIRSLEELLAACEVDLETWQVKDYSVNSWEQHSIERGMVTLYQIKARLERIKTAVDLTVLRKAVVDQMQEHSPAPVRRYKFIPNEGLAMEISIPDLHLGKLAHEEETGQNYDGKIAVKAFRHVFYGLLTHAQNLKVSRIIFPVGNDLLHVDGEENATTSGTLQDVDTRWYRSVRRAVDLMVEAVDAMTQIAPVDVVIVPGNHARMQEGMLGEVLRAWYRNEDRVTIHDSPAPRKYVQHGKTLLGFTHGNGIKAKDLPLIMATEAPQEWAVTEHRAWNTGHLHQRKSEAFGSVLEDKGVEVRVSPSLAATDAWHSNKGYLGNLRAAEAYVHDSQSGEIARFRATLPKDFS